MFDATAEVERLKDRKKLTRKRVYRRSRLEKYRGELMALRGAGASATELKLWLAEKRINVHLSTVTRWLDSVG